MSREKHAFRRRNRKMSWSGSQFRMRSSSSKKEESANKRLRNAVSEAVSRRGTHVGHVSTVLDVLHKHHCVEEKLSTDQIRRAAKKESVNWIESNSYTIELPLQDQTIYRWTVSSPAMILSYLVAQVACFSSLIDLLPRGQEVPYVAYHDEVQPGNVLTPDLRRKTVAICFSLLNWKHLYACENVWIPVATLRTEIYKHCLGGFSGALKILLQSWQQRSTHIIFRGTRYPLRLISLIMDEAAIQATWNFKGASGRKPCGLCQNLVSKAISKSLQGSKHFLGLSMADIAAFQPFTNAEIWNAVDHLKEQHCLLKKNISQN